MRKVCKMYNEVVKREKRWKFFMLIIGVPVCFGAIVAFWWFDVYGRRDHSPLWMKLGGTALLGYVIYEIIQNYFKFDKKLAAMKQAVGANTDDEMAAIFSRCTKIGEKYYVCRDCVLNFDSLLAYPCSAVLHVEPHVHTRRARPCIRITYGAENQWDYMYYDHHHSRDRAMEEMLHIMHS